MSSNYEFNKQMARDKQSALRYEAREHRQSKQASNGKGYLPAMALFGHGGSQLKKAAHWAAELASGYRSDLKTRLHWPGAATP